MIEEAVTAVNNLNDKLWECTKSDFCTPFSLSSIGHDHCIYFAGEQIWRSEEDGREQDEETCEWSHTIEEYCLQEAKKVLRSLLPILEWEK